VSRASADVAGSVRALEVCCRRSASRHSACRNWRAPVSPMIHREHRHATHRMISPVGVVATRLLPARMSFHRWPWCVPMLYGTRPRSRPARLSSVCSLNWDFVTYPELCRSHRGSNDRDSDLRASYRAGFGMGRHWRTRADAGALRVIRAPPRRRGPGTGIGARTTRHRPPEHRPPIRGDRPPSAPLTAQAARRNANVRPTHGPRAPGAHSCHRLLDRNRLSCTHAHIAADEMTCIGFVRCRGVGELTRRVRRSGY
jgi:hypothetical protein